MAADKAESLGFVMLLGNSKAALSLCVGIITGLSAFGAFAQTPEDIPHVRFSSAQSITITDALNYYRPQYQGNPNAHTDLFPEGRPLLIKDLASSLKNDPDRIYEFIHNTIRPVPMFGIQNGALGVIYDHSGTPFDIAILYVELLREAGLTASYELGRATLSSAQVNDWLGTTNATAVEQILQNGGIPAEVTGDGASLTVTMLHIWVSYNDGGQTRSVDPSFRRFEQHQPAADIGTLSGLDPQSLLTGQLSAQQPSQTGITEFTNFDSASVEALLDTAGQNLVSALRSSHPGARLAEILGGPGDIVQHEGPAPTGLPYSGSVEDTFQEVPDAFRTKVRIKLYTFEWSFFAEEIIGCRLWTGHVPWNSKEESSDDRWIHFGVDGHCPAMGLDQGLGPNVWRSSNIDRYPVEFEIDHPYASSGGTYMDRWHAKEISLKEKAFFYVNIGHTGKNYFDMMERYSGYNPHVLGQEYANAKSSFKVGQLLRETGFIEFLNAGASYLANLISLSDFNDRLHQTFTQHHHSFGAATILFTDHRWEVDHETWICILSCPDGDLLDFDNFAAEARVWGSYSAVLDFETSASVAAKDASPATAVASQKSFSAGASVLEGLAFGDVRLPLSNPLMFANRMDGNEVVDIAPQTSLQDIQSYFGSTHGVTSKQKDWMHKYSADGYRVFATRDNFGNSYNNHQGKFDWDNDPRFREPLAFVAVDESNGRFAHVVMNNWHPFKGAAAIDNNLGDQHVKQSAAGNGVSVDPLTGQVTFTPPPDLIVGTGDRKLVLQRMYSSGRLAQMNGIGTGWTHNFDQYIYWYTDVFHALKNGAAIESSSAILGLWAVAQLSLDPTDARHLGASQLVLKWLHERLRFNAASVKQGNTTFLVSKLANGQYDSRIPGAVTIEVQGNLKIRKDSEGNNKNSYDFKEIYIKLTNNDGSVTHFGNYVDETFGAINQSIFGYFQRSNKDHKFFGRKNEYPDGYYVDISYYELEDVSQTKFDRIGRVFDSFGNEINFIYQDCDGDNYRLKKVSDIDSAAYAEFRYRVNLPEYSEDLPEYYEPNKFCTTAAPLILAQVDRADGNSEVYRYHDIFNITEAYTLEGYPNYSTALGSGQTLVYDANNYVAQWKSGPHEGNQLRIKSVIMPDTAAISFAFNSLGQLRSVSQQGLSFAHFPMGLRAQVNDPLGNETMSFFDARGRLIKSVNALGQTTESEYDVFDRPARTIAPDGSEIRLSYDQYHNVIEKRRIGRPGSGVTDVVEMASYAPVTAPNGTAIRSWPEWTEDVRGQRTDYTYLFDANGFTRTTQGPVLSGGSRSQTVEIFTKQGGVDLLTRVEKAVGGGKPDEVAAHEYDTEGRLFATIVNPDGTDPDNSNLRTEFTYDGQDNLITVTDPLGFVTRFGFDVMRRQIWEVGAEESVTVTAYDGNGRTVQAGQAYCDSDFTASDTADATQSLLDAYNAAFSNEGATWNCSNGQSTSPADLLVSTTEYDTRGRPIKVTDPDGDVTQTQYDALGRPTVVTSEFHIAGQAAQTRQTRTVYDALGRATEVRNILGTALAGEYSSAGYTLANGNELTTRRMSYTTSGKIEWIEDAGNAANTAGNRTTYEYDGHDRLIKTTFPDATFETSTFDPVTHDLTQQVTRRGDVLAFSNYDTLGRVGTKTVTPAAGGQGNYSYSYTYDLLNRELEQTRTEGAAVDRVTHDYNAAGRMNFAASETGGISRTVTYGYDKNGNRTGLTWPDGFTVTYAYDSQNRLTSVSTPTDTLATYSHDRLSRASSASYGITGASATAAFEKDGDLQNIIFSVPNESPVTFAYQYNRSSEVVSRDVADLRFARRPPATPDELYAVNTLNQYTSVDQGAGAVTLTYDLNGNLTGDGTNVFAYDSENRLIQAAMGSGVTVDYTYDALGRRVEKDADGGAGGREIVRFLNDGDHEIAEYDVDPVSGVETLLRRYVFSDGVDRPIALIDGPTGAVQIYHRDRLGNIVALSDASGFTATYHYDAYGAAFTRDGVSDPNAPAVSVTSGQPFLFTGRRFDFDTGLYYYRARYYSASLGRFLQTDPIGYEDQMNLYAYVGNNPLNLTDPSGLGWWIQDAWNDFRSWVGTQIMEIAGPNDEWHRQVAANGGDPGTSFMATGCPHSTGTCFGEVSNTELGQPMFSVAQTAEWAEELTIALGNARVGSLTVSRNIGGRIPYGFRSAGSFRRFGRVLNGGLAKAGYTDARVLFQGSSVTGKSYRTGVPFDVGRVSDFDIAIGSQRMLSRARELGIPLRSGGTRTGPLKAPQIRQLGLESMQSELAKMAGRPVNFMIYGDASAAAARSPSIWVP